MLTVEPACRVTGVTNLTLLRASRIKPWAQCQTHAERLDKYNGLMLTPNADHAFDRGLITFDDSAGLIVSPKLPTLDAERLGVRRVVLTGPFLEAQQAYLAYHREHAFQW